MIRAQHSLPPSRLAGAGLSRNLLNPFFRGAAMAGLGFALLACGAMAQSGAPSPADLPDEPRRIAPEGVREGGSGVPASETIETAGLSSSAPFAAEDRPPGVALPGFGTQTPPHFKQAGPFDKYILPDQTAPKLTMFDKALMSLRHTSTPFALGNWLIISSFEQGIDASPNYGQTFKGYAQRLGAAAARGSSEGIFSDGILASVLHEDPRYYKMGAGHSFFSRLSYAATRPLISRTDGGRRTINFSLLGGNLAGSALTAAYYPPNNRNFQQVLQTFGGSIGGSAFGDVVAEFLSNQIYAAVHLLKIGN